MDNSTLYARSGHVVATEIGGEIVLLNTESWVCLEFDPAGSAIWGLLEQPVTLPQLVDKLTELYVCEPGRCRDDTKAFLDEMIGQGAVTATPGLA